MPMEKNLTVTTVEATVTMVEGTATTMGVAAVTMSMAVVVMIMVTMIEEMMGIVMSMVIPAGKGLATTTIRGNIAFTPSPQGICHSAGALCRQPVML